MQMQASAWICTYQMQTTKFKSCSPYLCAPLVQEYWSSSILLLLIHVHDRTLISSPPLSSKDNSYLCSFLSPFVINDHKRAETTWNFPCEDQWPPLEVVPLVLVGLPLEVVPLVGNHMKRLWFDTKSWTWVDGWVFNLHFWWTLSI